MSLLLFTIYTIYIYTHKYLTYFLKNKFLLIGGEQHTTAAVWLPLVKRGTSHLSGIHTSFPFSIKMRWTHCNYLTGTSYFVVPFRARNSRSSQMACHRPGSWFTTLGRRSALVTSCFTWAAAIASTEASSLPSNNYASWRRVKVGS